MSKTKRKNILKNLITIRNNAKRNNMGKVVAKVQLRIDNIYKTTKNKSLLDRKSVV